MVCFVMQDNASFDSGSVSVINSFMVTMTVTVTVTAAAVGQAQCLFGCILAGTR